MRCTMKGKAGSKKRMKKHRKLITNKYGNKAKRGQLLLAAAALLLAAAFTGCGQGIDQTQNVRETKTGVEDVAETQADQVISAQPQNSEASEEQEGVTFGDRELTGTEAAIYEKILQAAGQELLLFDCADFDGDGREEGFALAGIREDGFVSGKLWFAGESSAAVSVVPDRMADHAASDENAQKELSLLDASHVYEMPDGKKFWQVETFGGSVSESLLWSVKDGTARESVLSGKGGQFEETDEGDYLLYKYGLDAGTDGTGRTMKPCYFFYEDGEFHEYGAVSVEREQLWEIPGFEEVVTAYEEKGCWNRRYLLRGNGLVQASFQDRSNNYYVTLAMRDGKLETVLEGDGLAGLLIGGIADQTWRSEDDALKAVWDRTIRQYPGVNVRIYPGETVYYDLDGDGNLEKIRYREMENEEAEDFVNGLAILVDGEEAWENTESWAEWCRLYLTDLDSTDQKTELIAEYCSANDIVVSVKFLQFENKKMTEIADLCNVESMGEDSFIRYQGGRTPEGFGPEIPGDKTVTAWVDTPIWRNGFGSYYVKLGWKYDNGTLIEEKTAEYELRSLSDGQPWDYRLTVPITLYSEAACTTPIYEARPGEILHALAMQPAAGADAPLCIRVEVANDADTAAITGWIVVGDEQIFEEIPAWG